MTTKNNLWDDGSSYACIVRGSACIATTEHMPTQTLTEVEIRRTDGSRHTYIVRVHFESPRSPAAIRMRLSTDIWDGVLFERRHVCLVLFGLDTKKPRREEEHVMYIAHIVESRLTLISLGFFQCAPLFVHMPLHLQPVVVAVLSFHTPTSPCIQRTNMCLYTNSSLLDVGMRRRLQYRHPLSLPSQLQGCCDIYLSDGSFYAAFHCNSVAEHFPFD